MAKDKSSKKEPQRSYQQKQIRRQQILFGTLAVLIIVAMLFTAVAQY
jgi:hypothetical protein